MVSVTGFFPTPSSRLQREGGGESEGRSFLGAHAGRQSTYNGMARQLPFHVVFPSAVTQTDMLHRRNSERRLISSWTAEPFLSEPKWMSYYQGSPTKISQISTWSACSDDHEKFVRCDKSTKIFTNFPRIREKRRKGGIQLAISYRRPQATVTSLITCHF